MAPRQPMLDAGGEWHLDTSKPNVGPFRERRAFVHAQIGLVPFVFPSTAQDIDSPVQTSRVKSSCLVVPRWPGLLAPMLDTFA